MLSTLVSEAPQPSKRKRFIPKSLISPNSDLQASSMEICCLIIENNFLIGLDLRELLHALGFGHVDHAQDENGLTALLQSGKYDLAFIDYDQGEDFAQRMASQMRLQGADIIFTSTLLDQTELPMTLGECKLLSKPYGENALKDVLGLIQKPKI